MGESTVANVDEMVTTGEGEEGQKDQPMPPASFNPQEILHGQKILNLQEVDTDVERFKILEEAMAGDLIKTRALVEKFNDHVADTDQMAAVGAIQRSIQTQKAFVESMLARQKAELENFDKIRGDLITSVILQIQDALDGILEESSIGSELKDQIMSSLRERLQTIELDVEITAR